MKLFGFNKKKKETKFRITETDQAWVEDNFRWLMQVYGYPNPENPQITFSEAYFPATFSSNEVRFENLNMDFCQLLGLDAEKIKVEVHEDLRDSYGMPYEIHGKPFEAELEVLDIEYKIHLAKSILKRENRLLFALIFEYVKIRLSESKLKFETGEDTWLFMYLAGIYFGFGVPIAQNLFDIGRSSDGVWETKWNNISEMPNEVMAFALATYSMLRDEDNPEWKSELPGELGKQFEKAVQFINESPSDIYHKAEVEVNNLLHKAELAYKSNDFDAAITLIQNVLFLTKDDMLQADVYNCMGYYQTRKGDIEKSIPNFEKAIKLDPKYGAAYDNLGYALIQTGKIEEGKLYLDISLQMGNNDPGYSYRNLAVYHMAKNQTELARSNFELAFAFKTVPVDLLELHYANFLIDQGETESGKEYLEKAIEKDEPEALKRMNEIKKA